MAFLGGAWQKSGRRLVILGVSAENVRRLQAGSPMKLALDDAGVSIDLLVFYGETEEGMGEMMQRLVGPDTKVRVDERLYGGHD